MNAIDPTRAASALEDVVAVERLAPGMVRVVTWSDAYPVDARGEGCMCPDKQYNLGPGELCKHHVAAMLATGDLPAPFDVVDSLDERPEPETPAESEPKPLVADGSGSDEWLVIDHDRDNEQPAESRSEAEDMKATAQEFGSEHVEIVPPGRSDAATDGGTPEVVDAEPVESPGDQLPERSVSDDPLTWMPGEFIDEIDGTQAINRKGYEVLGHFYDVDVHADLEVAPEETDFVFCRVKATAITADGRACEAYGSAHVDRGDGDDPALLLEMADTRARKRALSIATGVGAVAVEELKGEVGQ